MAIPPLILKIIADSSGMTAGVAKANAEVGGLEKSTSSLANTIKIGLAGAAVAGFAVAAKAASDLGESQNKANVVFGDSVDVVNRFADTAAEGFGLSKAAALEAAGGFGAMLQTAGLAENAAADMSTTMVGLAGDMASFNNQDPSEMLERLRSGLAGEAEPLRKFGVFISEARVQTEAYKSGIAEVGAELTDAQKIQARYNIIMADTAKQQGDFARTVGESLPNQLRQAKAELTNLAAEMGQVFLPILTGTLKAFNDLPDAVKMGAAALVGLAGALSAVSLAVKALEGTFLAKLIGVLSGPFGAALATTIGLAVQFNNTMRSASEDIEAADKAINVGRGGMVLLGEGFRSARTDIGDMAGALNHTTGALHGSARGAREAADANKELADSHEEAAKAAREQRQAEMSLAGGLLGLVGDLGSVKEAQAEVNRLKRQGKTDSKEYREAVLSLANSVVSFKGNLHDWLIEQNKADSSTKDIIGRLVDLGREFGLTRADLERLLGPLREYVRGSPYDAKVHADTSQAHSAISNLQARILALIGRPYNVSVTSTIGGPAQRQHGGPVSRSVPYIVGEAGPELFVPSTSGRIVPNGSAGGGDIVFQIDGQEFARITRDQLLRMKGSRVSLGLS